MPLSDLVLELRGPRRAQPLNNARATLLLVRIAQHYVKYKKLYSLTNIVRGINSKL